MFKHLVEKISGDDPLDALCELDSLGLIPGPGEALEDFIRRLEKLSLALSEFHHTLETEGKVEVLDNIFASTGELIPSEIISEGAESTRKLYGFAVDWTPGFFLSRSLGLFWGGCTVHDSESDMSVFLIRRAFRKHQRFILYSRRELLAHELCHIVRAPLMDNDFEEYFAYQTSPSRLRRYLGNCFRARSDALWFVGPVFILLAAQLVSLFYWPALTSWPFWIFALGAPLLLLLRNQRSINTIQKARRNLQRAGIEAAPAVLFRCSGSEIKAIAILSQGEALKEFVAHKCENSLRWQIILRRFCPELFTEQQTSQPQQQEKQTPVQ